MINCFFRYVDKQKKNETTIVHFLALVYWFGKITWFHNALSAILGIIIPIIYEDNITIFNILIGVLVLDIFYVYVCNKYRKGLYDERRFYSEILSEQSSLIKSMVIEIDNNNNWKNKIFKTTSELVCEKIYQNFKELYNCRTRVSIEYVFDKNKTSPNVEKHVKMSGRRSQHRSTVKRAVPLVKRNKYFSYQIFVNNSKGVNVLNEHEIKTSGKWYINPNNSVNVKKYIGIAVSPTDSDDVKFILQIDCLDDIKFGKNNSNDDVQKFIEDNLMSYINTVSLSYMLNLTSKKEVMEV